ncbi:MAG: DUF1413 domain-containing protein [Eubacteriales bacterium]|nr:DUF1413 domain-containing protein [Eubacteriales bacterium]
MSKKVSILLNDSQHATIKKLAEKEGLTITDYIINKLPIEAENKITLSDVKKRIVKTKLKEFTIPDLYENQWSSFQKGSKLTIGKQFNKAVLNGEIENIIFKGKNSSNCAVYKKITYKE